MKTITFTPLRLIKKSGKITVSSYMQWRKIKSADYSQFILALNYSYKAFKDTDYVYNHKGEQLFWFNHKSPEELRFLTISDIKESMDNNGFDSSSVDGEEYKLLSMLKQLHWDVKGFDCDNVPVFSHNTADYIATHYKDMNQFEPLTVGMVKLWFGWFLFNLENLKLQIN